MAASSSGSLPPLVPNAALPQRRSPRSGSPEVPNSGHLEHHTPMLATPDELNASPDSPYWQPQVPNTRPVRHKNGLKYARSPLSNEKSYFRKRGPSYTMTMSENGELVTVSEDSDAKCSQATFRYHLPRMDCNVEVMEGASSKARMSPCPDASIEKRYEHYDARVNWDAKADELDVGPWSDQWKRMRMFYSTASAAKEKPVYFGMDPEALWMDYGIGDVRLRQDMDIHKMCDWIAKLRPRSILDFKPILILTQSILKDVMDGKLRIYTKEIERIKAVLGAEIDSLQADNIALREALRLAQDKGQEAEMLKSMLGDQQQASEELSRRQVLDGIMENEKKEKELLQEKANSLQDELDKMRKEMNQLKKEVSSLTTQKAQAEQEIDRLKKIAEQGQAIDPKVMQLLLKNQGLMLALKDGGFQRLITDTKFKQGLKSESFVKGLGSEGVLKALADSGFQKALASAAVLQALDHPYFIKALSSPEFMKALESPYFLKALGDPNFLKALGDPNFLKALSDPTFLAALGNADFLAALGNPAFLSMLANEDFYKLLKSEDFMHNIHKFLETLECENGGIKSMDEYYKQLERISLVVAELRTGHDFSQLADIEPATDAASLLANLDIADLCRRWRNFHLPKPSTTSPLYTLMEICKKLKGSTCPALPKDAADKWGLAEWLAQQMISLFNCSPAMLAALNAQLKEDTQSAVDLLCIWIMTYHPGLASKEEKSMIEQIEAQIFYAKEGVGAGASWNTVNSFLETASNMCKDLSMSPGRYHDDVARRRLQRVLLESMGQLMKGDDSNETSSMELEFQKYVNLSEDKLKDIKNFDADQMMQIKKIIQTYYKDLRGVYKHYAVGGAMSLNEFNALSKDTQLVDKSLTSAKLDILFVKVNVGKEDDESKKVDRDLSPAEFMMLLIQAACIKYEKGKLCPQHPSAKFEKLIVEVILPNAEQTDTDTFRKVLASAEIKGVQGSLNKEIELIYKHYAAADVNDKTGSKTLINSKEFETMLKDSGQLGGRINRPDLPRIMGSVQNDENVEEVDLEEFKEILCVCSQYKDPNPYVPPHKKLELFLTKALLPGLQNGASVKGLKAPYGKKGTQTSKRKGQISSCSPSPSESMFPAEMPNMEGFASNLEIPAQA